MKVTGVFSWNIICSLDKNTSNVLGTYSISMFREKEGVIYSLRLIRKHYFVSLNYGRD
jgi:hypothetical protein